MNAMQRLLGMLGAALVLGCTSLPAAAGEVRGVRAEYFTFNPVTTVPGFPSTLPILDRIEDTINFATSSSSPGPRVPDQYYIVRYTGYILVPTTGSYSFKPRGNDGVRLYVDCDRDGSFQASEMLTEQWADHSAATYTVSCPNTLTAGQTYAFRYEHFQLSGASTFQLYWTGPSPIGSTAVIIQKSDGTKGLTTGITDTTGPQISSAQAICGNATTMELVFSEQLDSTSAQLASNYSVIGHSVSAAALDADGKTVRLTVSPAVTATTTVTVNNVGDRATPMNTIASGSFATVSYSGGLASGLVGVYHDQNGTAGQFFTGSTVTRIDDTVDFTWGTGSPVSGIPSDNFSVLWSGLVLTTATAGSYTFSTTSDDGSELWVNYQPMSSTWYDHTIALNGSTHTYAASTYYPIVARFFDHASISSMKVGWIVPSASHTAIPAANLFHCNYTALGSFTVVPATTACSTCAGADVTISAKDTSGSVMTGYTGIVTLSTSTGRGDWSVGSSPSPAGTFVAGTSNSGSATYTFVAGDAGVVKLKLTETRALDVVVTARDTDVTASTSTSSTLSFRDNAFVFAEDASNKIGGSDIAVAGRPHDYTVSLVKKDPGTGSCGVATDYTGSRLLKLWRSDSNGSWTAPTATTSATTALPVPSSQPASGNVTMAFTSGAASLTLGTTDIGRYGFSLLDDNLNYASNAISGSSNTLTVRPFTIVINNVKTATTANPGGSLAGDPAFTSAGSAFQATIGAYKWSSSADSGNDGVPDTSSTYAQITSSGLTPSFNSTVKLTKTTTSAGSIVNGDISNFSGGTTTVSNLAYTEVGAFTLNTTGVVTDFLGSGLSLDAMVFRGASNSVKGGTVGRFHPYAFVAGAVTLTHRADLSCPSSTFTYLDENFRLNFPLSAVNAFGNVTTKYTSTFAKLDLSSAANLQLAGIANGTSFATTGSARLSLGTVSGSWSNGVAAIALTAAARRSTTPDGPFSASFGIAPSDSDGVAMWSYDIDTDSVAGNDHSRLADVLLRYGRLRLSNAVGSQGRALSMPLTADYWDGATFTPNSSDSCTTVPLSSVNFGNHRKTLGTADTTLTNSSLALSAGASYLKLAAPSGSHSGSFDVSLSLGPTATDTSCLQPWTPAAGKTATQGAGLAYLRGGWCGATYDKDPAARAAFGVFHGTDRVLYQRENH